MIFTLSIQRAIKECCERYNDVCYVLEGDSLYGDVIRNMTNDSMCVTICDRMIHGKVMPEFRTYKFVLNRIKANSFINYKVGYNGENIVSDIISMENMIRQRNKKFVLIQWDFLLDDLWRLFAQALLEKNNLTKEIILLKFYSEKDIIKTDFEPVNIKGSYEAFKDTICKHRKKPLKDYGISEETIDFFIDIKLKKSKVLRYIRKNIIDENNLSMSYLNYLKDDNINKFGLSDFDFYKLMYEKLKTDGEDKLAEKFARTWRR